LDEGYVSWEKAETIRKMVSSNVPTKGRHGDRANAVLCAAGYNFRLILSWLRFLLRQILDAIFVLSPSPSALKRRFTLAS